MKKVLTVLLCFLSFSVLMQSQDTKMINKYYKWENAKRNSVIPTLSGLHYEELYRSGNKKKPKLKDHVKINIKVSAIDGTFLEEHQQKTYHLARFTEGHLKKLREGIRKMRIGDYSRMFITPSPSKRREDGYLVQPLTLIYEVELVDITEADGYPRHPAETVRYESRIHQYRFDTKALFSIAKAKAEIRATQPSFDWDSLHELMLLIEDLTEN